MHYMMISWMGGAEEPSEEIVVGSQTLGWRTQAELAAIFELMRP